MMYRFPQMNDANVLQPVSYNLWISLVIGAIVYYEEYLYEDDTALIVNT